MFATKLRHTILTLLAASSVTFALAAISPVTSAHAEDNGDTEISQEDSCALLQDAYTRAVNYAIAARLTGDTMQYEFWADFAQETYFDAEFNEGCDWAARCADRLSIRPEPRSRFRPASRQGRAALRLFRLARLPMRPGPPAATSAG